MSEVNRENEYHYSTCMYMRNIDCQFIHAYPSKKKEKKKKYTYISFQLVKDSLSEGSAILHLQKADRALNRIESLWKEILEQGRITIKS